MGKEFPVAGGIPFLGPQTPGTPGQIEGALNEAQVSRFFGWIHYKAIGQLTGTLDYVLIVCASIAAGIGYHSIILRGNVPDLVPYIGAGNIVAALFILGAASRGSYSPSKIVSARLQVRSIIFFWPLAFLSLALFLFLAKSGADFSRGTIIIFGILGFFLLLVSHIWISATLKGAMERATLAGDRAITIGDSEAVRDLSPTSILQKAGAREIRRYLLPSLTGSDASTGLRLIDEAIQFVRSNSVDCVLLALQWNDERLRNLICDRLQVLPIRVLLLPDQHVQSIFSRTRQLGREFTIEIQRPPITSGELALKRALDVILASGVLVALAPLLAAVAILIRLETPGPLIFRQRRKGFNGREFTIFKFRTMDVLEDGRVVPQAHRNDPRVTRVGRILRATSIDELPQLVNVLRGHMSLVGPRPHAAVHDDAYTKLIAKYAFRQHVKPGLTGWAQVNGFRGETPRLELMEQRVDCDLWYIKNWSFWLDLRILVLTGFELVRSRNAY
jgi:undecaprenyl-phosphate galactose phosphotransferase/putative colanic acid biosynthesis UDP-glucose lipid carrier transferase